MKATDRCKVDISNITKEQWDELRYEATRQRTNRVPEEWNKKNIFPYARFWEITGTSFNKYLIDCKYQTIDFMYDEDRLDPKKDSNPLDVGRDFSKYNGMHVMKLKSAILNTMPFVEFFDKDREKGFIRCVNEDIRNPRELCVDNVIIVKDFKIDPDYKKLIEKPGFGIPVGNEPVMGTQPKMWRIQTQEELDALVEEKDKLRKTEFKHKRIDALRERGIMLPGDTLDDNNNIIRPTDENNPYKNNDKWNKVIDIQLDYMAQHPDYYIPTQEELDQQAKELYELDHPKPKDEGIDIGD